MVTLDGQRGYSIQKGEHVTVNKSPFSVRLIHVEPKRPFYSLLRSKLSWEWIFESQWRNVKNSKNRKFCYRRLSRNRLCTRF